MNGFDTVITGAKIVTSQIHDKQKDQGYMRGSFGTIEDYFPQGLPQRLAGLDRGSKFLLAAVKEALQGREHDDERNVGVAVATLLGSNSSRIRFLQGVLGEKKPVVDPIAFKTTVPSVAAGAVAVLYRCCGPTITCIGNGEAGLTALHNAYLLIRRGITKKMIVGGYEDFSDELLRFVPQHLKGEKPWLEGAAALIVKNKTVDAPNEEKILAKIDGFGLSSRGVKPDEKKTSLRKAMQATIFYNGQQAVDYIVSAGTRYSALEQDMCPGIPIIDTTIQWGEHLGMSGIINLVTAIELLNDPDENLKGSNLPKRVLVNGMGMSGTAYSVMLSRSDL